MSREDFERGLRGWNPRRFANAKDRKDWESGNRARLSNEDLANRINRDDNEPAGDPPPGGVFGGNWSIVDDIMTLPTWIFFASIPTVITWIIAYSFKSPADDFVATWNFFFIIWGIWTISIIFGFKKLVE